MKQEQFENPWQKKVRNLSHLLIFSVSLNMALGVSFVLWQREKKIQQKEIFFSTEEMQLKNPAESLQKFFTSSFAELAAALEDKTKMQDGFTYRDFALATLINFHDLDIKRALSGFNLQMRNVSFVHTQGGENFSLKIVVGLEDHHYVLISAYIREHPWPQTPKGLFALLKEKREEAPTSLVTTFFATPEFYAVYTMLHRMLPDLAMEKVLLMLLDGSYEMLQESYQLLQEHAATNSFVHGFFKRYLKAYSSYAASIWVDYDSDDLIRQLDDETLLEITSSLRENTPKIHAFLKKIITSIRKDAVREAAAKKIYEFSGLDTPEIYDHEKVLSQIFPKAPLIHSLKPHNEPPKTLFGKEVKTHIVQSGDSLWKVARRYNTSIEAIKKFNHLRSDLLRPGQELDIPQ